jgi:hypothetical protein
MPKVCPRGLRAQVCEFNAELRAAEAELAQPVEVEHAMRMLGRMIGQIGPEAQPAPHLHAD